MSQLLPGLLVSFAVLFAPFPTAARTPASVRKALPFPQTGSDLKPDPAARFGTLPNGLRYVVLANQEPKQRASLRLLVLAGSLHEADNQRGLAHFVEHMAFNGSKHYPPGTLVEFFQRMGMSFGGDTNANTGFDRTIYLLELAHADDATLPEGLRVLNDYAGGLLFSEQEINKERGVILSEKRASDSVGFRTFVARFDAMLGTTRFPKRIPIGVPEVIKNAPRRRFVDFWTAWYRPERMALVVVGDFADTAVVEKMITSTLADLTARAPGRSEPSLGKLARFDGVRAIFHPEPEAPQTNIWLTNITPYVREPDTAARRVKRLPRSLALAMLNRRFAILAKTEDAPFVSAGASVSEQFNFLRQANLDLSCKPEQWPAALAVGEQELRRALEHGFTAAELIEARANLTNDLDQAVKTASTRHSNQLADEIVQNLLDGEVFTTPVDELALLKPALEKIALADCQAALRADFTANGRFVMVTGNAEIPGDASGEIMAAYDAARAIAVSPPDPDQQNVWGYTDFGVPGEVEKREHVPDLGIELVTFRNGVRLNLKKTDFEAGRIVLNARIGSGGITEPAGQRGLAAFAGGTFIAGGLARHSADDLRNLFAGKNVGWQFAPDAEAFRFSGGTTRDDLLLELQLLAAHLTEAGYRPEALRVARKGLEQLYLSFEHTPNGPLATEIANLLANGDPRFGMPDKETMMARNLDEVKTWLTPQFASGPLEVALVGDLEVKACISAAAQTIGALAPREPKLDLVELKKVAFPGQPFAKDYTIDSEIPKGALLLYWPTDDGLDIRRSRRLSMLASTLNDRLRVKVREEIGGSYSPRASSNASDTFAGYGYLMARIDVDPPSAGRIADLVINLADDLATNGVTEDELDRARRPLLTALKESLRNNSYWLSGVLARAQEKPEVLDWARSRIVDVEAITTAEISDLARKYLDRARVSRATVLPAMKPSAAAAAPANDK